jgi:predicted nucleotidyltransferase
MRPSLIFNTQRNTVREVVSHFRVANVRIFGSVLAGTDREGSDLDLLVDALPETTLFDLGGLQMELESLLGIPVDVRTPSDLPLQFRAQVLAQAQPV